jgi:hypothetical protein
MDVVLPYESPEMREMVKSLIETIKETNKATENYNKSMQNMTLVIVFFTIVQVVAIVASFFMR